MYTRFVPVQSTEYHILYLDHSCIINCASFDLLEHFEMKAIFCVPIDGLLRVAVEWHSVALNQGFLLSNQAIAKVHKCFSVRTCESGHLAALAYNVVGI